MCVCVFTHIGILYVDVTDDVMQDIVASHDDDGFFKCNCKSTDL